MHLQDVLNMSISDFIGERKRLEIGSVTKKCAKNFWAQIL